jgi:hypothetical protein
VCQIEILSVSAGAQHTCGVFKGGYARCWGANESNQLGLGHTQFEGDLKPYQLIVFDSGGNPVPAGPIDFGGIAVAPFRPGRDFTCALLADQSIRCWGKNTSGQLGLGNTNSYSTATPKRSRFNQPWWQRQIRCRGQRFGLCSTDHGGCPLLGCQRLRSARYGHDGRPLFTNTSADCSQHDRLSELDFSRWNGQRDQPRGKHCLRSLER